MRKTLCILTLGWLSALMAVAQNGTEQTVIIGKATPDQRTTCIDRDWRFCYGDGSAAIAQPDVTSGWRLLDLPHDWSVETEAAQAAGGTVVGPFTTASIGGYQTAFTVGGEGWYAKRLSVKGKRHRDSRQILYFEGAYNQTEVYVNGQKLHFNPYGYISFRVDVSDALHEGDNWLLVRVANEGNNSRWYAGSGIYRHVWLIQTPRDAYLDSWNLQATTQQQADGTWQLVVEAPIEGVAKGQQALQHTLYDAAGRKVATVSCRQSRQVLRVEQPELWSPDHPYCYQLETQLMAGRKVKDRLTTRVGFRSLSFTADKGFLLNGQPMLIRGGCVHHDNGLLGAAAFDRAEVRRLQLVKAQGYNAVRTSHGLPSESFLNACDTLGLMVVDETFDQWLMEKNPDDYHRFFPEHSTSDLQTMIRRDRNHPSIVMWSIGNEIPGRIEPEGLAVAERLRQTIRQLDTTRPVTAAICGWDNGDTWNSAGHSWEQQDGKAFRSLDVGGYNYLFSLYERDHGTHPDRVMCGLESFPKLLAQNWDLVERLPYVMGDFVWTAMDYLGEAGIGSAAYREEGNQTMFQPWPWYNGWCGDIDIIGQKKPQSYFRDVVWRLRPVTMAVERLAPAGTHQSVSMWGWQLEEQSWTYPDLTAGDTVAVNVYSRAPQVRLYVNGKAMGDQKPGRTYWTCYRIPYTPGTLRVVNLDAAGREVAGEDYQLQTTGQPVALRLKADRSSISTGRADLAYVTIELVDAEGRVCTSNSDMTVQLSAEGDGQMIAAGNASPTDMQSFRSSTPRLFQGRALAILRSGDRAGNIRLTATAEGLPAATIDIETIP